ncbi:hypothetical protein HUA74_15535 [Myxococcus sp. CA051A]|uniref:hypothetical protein n=1 Tax=Myxococcus sp. CA051A TaxID=2741739 RepID=UPI00157B747E|nr:hypothetical protein [Myxococcus sp. CA051A]NTX62072.1 hypothetical protein [Myxococcus sp. CA051A]
MMRKLIAGGAMMMALTTGLFATTSMQSPPPSVGGAFAEDPATLTSGEQARLIGRCSVDGSFCINTADCQRRGMGTCG